ncbi:Lrp/AsnC family transcriptional regulator [Amorphus orientalis]|uniref:DNA-binding Lrp family transcriptional regulator n=1 Tax=Amorphus orientalis TaxID=649198 RepID=A0AAE3VLT4_9HYPH|nr:Lrp/AsnC family transcriptional regulator [Amorphus orientalis]MDQ0314031.1 DNA-binding Lrp family transcriptional regulator [Amorphus orientalis]
MRETTVDSLDLKLLRALAEDGRASHVVLGDRIGLSASAVARRQRSLEESGLIAGYRAVIGLKALGLGTTVIVRITLDSQSEEALSAFETAVARCPSVIRCFLMAAADDYLVLVAARDIADYERIHTVELSRLPHVARLQSSFALREVVDRPMPIDALTR